MTGTRAARSGISDQLMWSPAGPNSELAAVLEELAAGKYVAASDYMTRSWRPGEACDVRCYQMLLMAQAAVQSGAAERWVAERPQNREVWALLARVAVLRAVRAHQHNSGQLDQLVAQAQEACDRAAALLPQDPVPWLARLQLAVSVPTGTDPESGALLYEPARPLFTGVRWRHPLSREGHYRMLTAVVSGAGGSVAQGFDFVQAVMHGTDLALAEQQVVPDGSVLYLLPVLMHLNSFRSKAAAGYRNRVVAADSEWATYAAKFAVTSAYWRWFESGNRVQDVLLPDLHLLAHALWKAELFDEAATVFEVIGPWGLPVPWNAHGDPERVFRQARDRCLKPPG